MMKRSLIKWPTLVTSILLVASFHLVVFGQEFRFNNKPYIARQKQPRYPSQRSAPVVRAQIGNDGYSRPSLSPRVASYPPATTSGYNTNQPVYNAGASPAANNMTGANYAANNSAGANYANNTTSSNGYQNAPTSKRYGNEPFNYNWTPGLGPAPMGTGDPAGQGGGMSNWGGATGGSIFAPDPSIDGSYGTTIGPRPQLIPVTIFAPETQTGRLMFGVGVNSDAGFVASAVLDEQNFDFWRFPRSFEDIRNATAWRGKGQRFRLEAVPGTEVQRYMASLQIPYLMGSRVSLGLSGNYYTRIYRDWSEDRVGGSVQLGYHITHALTGSIGFRGARVDVFNIPNPAPQQLLDVAYKHNTLLGFQARLAHDTRDSTFMPTEGHLIELGVEQVLGTYQYPKIDLEARKYFWFKQRADKSGRHVLSLSYRLGWAGDDTPIYDNYFAGGYSTIRGFDYRCASPYDAASGVFVGGHFQMLASAEYLFPITADDMLRGVVFCDTGTVEPSISDWTDKYRVAPGFGLRITVPAMGPAPIALDFAFPVIKEDSDWVETFSFFVGMTR